MNSPREEPDRGGPFWADEARPVARPRRARAIRVDPHPTHR